ncbi:uncharacterized membrane protein YcaP (DUF421 family) [Bacillus pakistanensis]|uniref:Uncharacterized membrane protein YcaP (DUF421 family) n=1 Tax=Rossellomorea pakistanensis TaxID=992288 RepID=A0ABS2NK00_9BACI|nr:YetF domain-containing protein [Bacillus pakistanensis]MBM7588145.1 uncharacterized membrane protein YcaP (DUF421 family) [Bacillus pakistanensis]
MDLDWIWKAILIVIVGFLILRLAGRKSISQLTVAQTVLMISIGNLIIQPVTEKNIWITFLIVLLLIFVLIIIESLQIKFDRFETFITGKGIDVIENGEIIEKNLKKLRITIVQLEMRLRQDSISKISDVKTATIEPSGQLGYVLKDFAQYATKEDIKVILDYIHHKFPAGQQPPDITKDTADNHSIFSEVDRNEHVIPPPKHLE